MTTNNSWNSNIPVTVARGGTGNSSNSANNVLVGQGTSSISGIVPGDAGTALTSNGVGVLPSFKSISNLGMSWVTIGSFGTFPATVNTGYRITSGTGGVSRIQLPLTSAVGDVIRVVRAVGPPINAGAFTVDTNFGAGQKILGAGTSSGSVDGFASLIINMSVAKQSIDLICIEANTTWLGIAYGSFTFY